MRVEFYGFKPVHEPEDDAEFGIQVFGAPAMFWGKNGFTERGFRLGVNLWFYWHTELGVRIYY